VNQVLADRYELGAPLGAGGMARVVAAYDRVLDRQVAVKLLRPTPDPVARERFVREARTAARLRHPHAVLVYDAGEHDDQPYIVMELVDGESLGDLLDRVGPMDIEEAVAITLGVLEVLAAAHAQGLIHRDIKPGNVLLPTEGGVKLADFGIAKAMDEATSGLTATGAVVGTATYLAPELVAGGASSPASDVYSVGCLLYALLTGDPPFTGDSALAIAYAQRHTPVPPIETSRPDLPADLRAVIDRALQKDPADRYADAGAMRRALLDGPSAVPAPLPPVATVPALPPDPTVVLATDGPVAAGDRGRAWTGTTIAVVLALALLLGLAGWWAAAQLGAGDDELTGGPLPGDTDEPDATGEPDAPAGADDGEPDDGGPPEEPAEEAPDETAGVEDDDPGAEEQPEELPEQPTTVEELVALLAATPTGAYGEKHDDLLEDLVALTREDDPAVRAEEAQAVRDDVADWVDDGELDAELGRTAIAILDREAAAAGE
jgi:eukaryotic-like serine/threonine-protein kinase